MDSKENLWESNTSVHQVPPLVYVACTYYLAAITIFGALVNIIVIYTVFTDNKLFTPVNLVLLNLAFADSGIAFLGNPVAFYNASKGNWMFGKNVCVVYGFLMSLFGICSIYTLSLLAYQRYHIICRPFSHKSALSWFEARLYIFGTWLCSFLVSLPPIFGWGSYENEAANISCSINWESREINTSSYIMFLFIVALGVPIFVIAFSYSNILRTVKQANRSVALMNRQSGAVRKAETHVARMVFVMVLAFFVAWGPYAVFSLLIAFTEINVTKTATIVPSLFAKSSVCYNPLIYFFLNSQFRKSLLRRMGISQEHNQTEHTNNIRQLPLSQIPARGVVDKDQIGITCTSTVMSDGESAQKKVGGINRSSAPITEYNEYLRRDLNLRTLIPYMTLPAVRKKYIFKTRSAVNIRVV